MNGINRSRRRAGHDVRPPRPVVVHMSFDYEFDSIGRIATITPRDGSNLAESLRAVRGLASDIRLEEGIGVLMDLRGVEYSPSWDEADALAAAIARSGVLRHHRVALLASGPMEFALASMIASLSGLKGAVVHAFRSVETAKAWLRRASNEHDQRRH